MNIRILLAIATVCGASLLPAAPTSEADRSFLLEGVKAINTNGSPGGVGVVGPDAFAVVAGKSGPSALTPVVGAARLGKGRVVAFGHDGFLASPKDADTGKFLVNAARWTGGDRPKPKIGVVRNPALLAHLVASGFDAAALDSGEWAKRLGDFDSVFINGMVITPPDVGPLENFIRKGGGLVTGLTGWGWSQVIGKGSLSLASDCPGNVLIQKAGLVFTGNMPERTGESAYQAAANLDLLSAPAALEAVISHTKGRSKLSGEELMRCGGTLVDAVRSLPEDEGKLLPGIFSLAGGSYELPTDDRPLAAEDSLNRLKLVLDIEKIRATKPMDLKAHPAAATFPGPVPKSAPRLRGTAITVDTSVPRWHGTGLYAAPGEVIRVKIPASAAGKGLPSGSAATRTRFGISTFGKGFRKFPAGNRSFPRSWWPPVPSAGWFTSTSLKDVSWA